MNFISLINIELKKIKRSKIIFILLISVGMIMISMISSAKINLKSEGINPGYNMFIQSALSLTVFMLPLSFAVITVLLSQTERKNRGIIKMLTLPVSPEKIALAKFCTVIFIMAGEIALFLILYIPSQILASNRAGINLSIPTGYILNWGLRIFAASIPMASFFFMISICINNAAASLGLQFLFTVPIILAANTKYWFVYAADYPAKLIMQEQGRFMENTRFNIPDLNLWILSAVLITILTILISAVCFSKTETK